MSPKKPSVLTRFWVAGEAFDPDELTRLLRIQPTKSGRKGDPSPYPHARTLGRTMPETSWSIEIERSVDSIDEGIQELLRIIWEQRTVIIDYLSVRPSVKAGILVVVHYYDESPLYELSLDAIQKLAHLGCEFAMDDIYKEDESDV